MLDPKKLFGTVPKGKFVDVIGSLKVGTRVDRYGSMITVELLQTCDDGGVLAYFRYDSGAVGCCHIKPDGRFP